MKAQQPVSLTSAGGVVYRFGSQGPECVVLHHAGFDEWRLPKGKLREGEAVEEAAIREVREETGLEARIIMPLGTSSYEYQEDDGIVCAKTVHYFLLLAADEGALAPEEPTFDAGGFFPLWEAYALLTWDNEKQMVRRAERMIVERHYA